MERRHRARERRGGGLRDERGDGIARRQLRVPVLSASTRSTVTVTERLARPVAVKLEPREYASRDIGCLGSH